MSKEKLEIFPYIKYERSDSDLIFQIHDLSALILTAALPQSSIPREAFFTELMSEKSIGSESNAGSENSHKSYAQVVGIPEKRFINFGNYGSPLHLQTQLSSSSGGATTPISISSSSSCHGLCFHCFRKSSFGKISIILRSNKYEKKSVHSPRAFFHCIRYRLHDIDFEFFYYQIIENLPFNANEINTF